jgi:hypothetical protein
VFGFYLTQRVRKYFGGNVYLSSGLKTFTNERIISLTNKNGGLGL